MRNVLVSQGSRNDAHNLDDLLLRFAARYDDVPSVILPKHKPTTRKTRLSHDQFRGLLKNLNIDELRELHKEYRFAHAKVAEEITTTRYRQRRLKLQSRRKVLGRRIDLINRQSAEASPADKVSTGLRGRPIVENNSYRNKDIAALCVDIGIKQNDLYGIKHPDKSLGDYFVVLAKEALPDDEYQRLVDQAVNSKNDNDRRFLAVVSEKIPDFDISKWTGGNGN